MPRNVVDDDVVEGGGGGVAGASVATAGVATAGRGGLVVLSVVDGGGGVGEGRKLDCTICYKNIYLVFKKFFV